MSDLIYAHIRLLITIIDANFFANVSYILGNVEADNILMNCKTAWSSINLLNMLWLMILSSNLSTGYQQNGRIIINTRKRCILHAIWFSFYLFLPNNNSWFDPFLMSDLYNCLNTIKSLFPINAVVFWVLNTPPYVCVCVCV